MPVPCSFAKIPIKKDMSEFWGLNVTSQMKAGVQTTRGLIHIQRDARDSRRLFPLRPVIPCFLGMEHQEGSFLPSCGIKKIPHMWYISWYLKSTTYLVQNAIFSGTKKYHICGTKTSIVVSKDTTYVVHFADASKKGLFSDSPFLFFECISTKKTSAETVTSVTCFGSTVILPNDSEWGF